MSIRTYSKLRNHNKKNGFTLIELLVVILIISILIGLLVKTLNVQGTQAKGRDVRRKGDIKLVQGALESYYYDHRTYPDSGGSWLVVDGSASDTLTDTLKTSGDLQNPVSDPIAGPTSATNPCNASTSQDYYYYSAGPSYFLIAIMELPASSADSPCSGFTIPVCGGTYPTTCYAVKNP